MTYQILLGLATFAFVTSITPGPNNIMLMTSGANFGFRQTIPHMLGVGIGFTIMVVLVGVGLAELFNRYPTLHNVLKVVSIVYLLYLAWKISQSGAPGKEKQASKPLSFWQAALFQWVNPKGWTMALTAVTVYAPSQNFGSIILVAVVFGAINLPSVSTWVALGQNLKRFLSSPKRLQVFNYVMAGLLIASLGPILQ